MIRRWLLPDEVEKSALPLLVARALRAFADGFIAVLLPAYLLALGLSTLDVGILSTATLLGSALATLAVGAWLIIRKHPKMFQLWGLSLNQKSYYDPRKR